MSFGFGERESDPRSGSVRSGGIFPSKKIARLARRIRAGLKIAPARAALPVYMHHHPHHDGIVGLSTCASLVSALRERPRPAPSGPAAGGSGSPPHSTIRCESWPNFTTVCFDGPPARPGSLPPSSLLACVPRTETLAGGKRGLRAQKRSVRCYCAEGKIQSGKAARMAMDVAAGGRQHRRAARACV